MLEGISWSQFIICTGVALAVYYVLLFVVYAKKAGLKSKQAAGQLPVLTTRKRIWQAQEEPLEDNAPPKNDYSQYQPPSPPPNTTSFQPTTIEEQLFDALETLADDLEIAISNADRTEWSTLKPQLQQLVAQYPALHREPYKKAILTHVEKCLKNELDMDLPPDTFSSVWVDPL